jgi:hypothetical protein
MSYKLSKNSRINDKYKESDSKNIIRQRLKLRPCIQYQDLISNVECMVDCGWLCNV